MAEYEFPSDLVEAQRTFLEADARLAEINARMPRSTAIVAGEASIPDDLRRDHAEVWAQRDGTLDVLYGHSWWMETPNTEWHAARMALRKAAQA
ncbi:hypothetical protein GCM10009530_64110 [Microbispora corallina]|uniref:Uncharacterized protein n=1 Tax=Microbispora corallina TaxID=83302 RepID=A0ABQ4GCI8_9ACTN|nr:hypothetical protein [Microbispora corallina]GIH44787.1 hypothetical protein Mco01_77870 [Microbispora corallina]